MNLSPVLKQRFFDANGVPLAGGQLYSYAAGTSTPQATYSNATGTSNANPVVLDSNGYADVWVDPTLAYKFVLQDANSNTLWTVDNVTFPLGVATWNSNTVYSQGSIVQDSSGQGLLYVSLTNSNQNNALSSVSNWRVFAGNVRTLSANTTLAVTDDLVRSNSTSGNLTHTLPACSTTPVGKAITVKDVGTGGNYTQVKGSGSDNIDGANIYTSNLSQYAQVTVKNNGSSWDVVTIGDNSVTTNKIAAQAVTAAKIANGAIGQAQRASLPYVLSSSSAQYSTTSASYGAVTNLTGTLTTTGRPVLIALVGDGSITTNGFENTSAANALWLQITRDGTVIYQSYIQGGSQFGFPAGSVWTVDVPSAASHTYVVNAKSDGTHAQYVYQMCLFVMEL